MKKLPIGIQTFKTIIEENYLYIDKTDIIHELISGKLGNYFFLSRPRRFGKSLLISTLKELFLGNRHLFESLKISKTNYNWVRHPVIHLDFSSIAHSTPEELKTNIAWKLEQIGRSYNIDIKSAPSIESKLEMLLIELSKINKVVILIDEYDKPILDHIEDLKQAHGQQTVLRSFYSAIKSLDEYIKFIFLTGITKFSKTSVFSGLNNLIDITFSDNYSALLGYTQSEIVEYLSDHIHDLEVKLGLNYDQIKSDMQFWYNGYQFSEAHVRVYNPYSVLLYLSNGKLYNYWFETGTPSFLVNLIKTKKFSIESIENCELNALDLGALEIDDMRLIPLLFQTGYLTIKSYNSLTRNYHLSYPNEETKISFLHYFVSSLTNTPASKFSNVALELTNALIKNDIDLFFETLKIFFAGIPYNIQISEEKYYQSIFYVIINLVGAHIEAEVATNNGRIDAIIQTINTIYIFEFKLDNPAETAFNQIKQKEYYQKYLNHNKDIIIVGVKFDSKKRNIVKWIREKV